MLSLSLGEWRPGLFPGDQISGSLLMGTSMALTAFPVLVFILKGRISLQISIGNISLLTAAIDNLMSWILLASVVAFARSGS